ncbi:MAG: hypothetical protein AAGC68_16605 [Verrucomicrobiota bacterium]
MAILRSSDGKFYEVADDLLEDKLIPAEQIKEKLGQVEAPASSERDGDVEAHGWCWRRNWFSNCWRRNCWRNYCYR